MKITKAEPSYDITDTWNGYEVTGTLSFPASQGKVINLLIVKDDTRYSFNYQDKPNVSLYMQCSEDIRVKLSEYCNNAVSTILSTYNS